MYPIYFDYKADRSHGSSLMPIVIQTRKEVPLIEHCLFKGEFCKVLPVLDAWTGPAGSEESVLAITGLKAEVQLKGFLTILFYKY